MKNVCRLIDNVVYIDNCNLSPVETTDITIVILVLRDTDNDGVGRLLEASGAQPLVNDSFKMLR